MYKGLLLWLCIDINKVFSRLSHSDTNTNEIIKFYIIILPDILRDENQIAAVEHRAFSHRGVLQPIY